MTEAEWLACRDPMPMLRHLGDRAGGRKLRLFGCACCRRIRSMMGKKASRKAVAAAEKWADGLIDEAALWEAHGPARDVAGDLDSDEFEEAGPAAAAAELVCNAVFTRVSAAMVAEKAQEAERWLALESDAEDAPEVAVRQEAAAQAGLVRELFTGLVTGAKLKAGFRPPAVVSLASVAYEERKKGSGELDLARLAVLSDALEEAGCSDADILAHLRSPGPHVRGCWALDLVLREG